MMYQFTMREHIIFGEYVKLNGINYATKFDYLRAMHKYIIGE